MLRIPQSVYDDMRGGAEQAYPHECCGVLLGREQDGGVRVISEVVSCRNANTDSPATRYNIAPHELIRILRESRERGLEIVGFYHSHPEHPPQWSPTDLEQAYWVGCSYVITNVRNGVAAETKSFLLDGMDEQKRFVDESFEIV
jgi:proteasome lid subunit RPN8/RPN11